MEGGITVKNKKVYFAGKPVAELMKRFDNPLFVFSQQRLIDNYKALVKAFRKHYPKTSVYYSIKTNFEPSVLGTLRSLGSFGEAASGLEVTVAKKAGFKGSELIVDGPAWTDEDIELFIKEGLRTLNVDSLDLMHRVNSIAKKLKRKVRVSFRIYPEMKISLLKSFIENYISKFGVRLSKAIEAYAQAQKLSNVEIVGISAHIGSMITDPGFYEQAIDRFVKLAHELKKKLGINISEINIGGGYGVQSLNYYSIQNIILSKAGVSAYSKAASIAEFGERIAKRFKNNLKKYHLPEIELILEPGRFLVSDAGVLLTKVVSVKDNWVFIDGGINLIPESLFFIRRGFIVDGKAGVKANKKYNVAGPTLNTADVLSAEQLLPETKTGDLMVVLDAGAYSLTRSNQFTILRPNVVFVNTKGQVKLIRKKESPQ